MTALDDESTHVGGGSFRYDKKRRAAKMKENVEKIWRHRAGVIFEETGLSFMLKSVRGMPSDTAKIFIVVAATVIVGGPGLFFWRNLSGGALWGCACWIITMAIPCTIAYWIIPSYRKIAERWNP